MTPPDSMDWSNQVAPARYRVRMPFSFPTQQAQHEGHANGARDGQVDRDLIVGELPYVVRQTHRAQRDALWGQGKAAVVHHDM